ncbi:HesB/IscA family protein [Hyalangium rubrum]|uniref:Iron-sulfur cluster assembly accessory protein n=1 Tax=Hyalangium rubrum TaxID=3103134 RepID=A0ABU5GW32_9BACT|nr:iron-sulfur cluster assembly accessory protein [Hyalangium sp. s54d21]MDY7225296.1 iron-sulfur cluster assembly accessory protein [Hyalangium sp. s54d21]
METTTTTPATPVAQPAWEPTPHVPMRLSVAAISQVKEVIKAQGFEGYFFSIRVVPAGCSGLGYDLNLVKEAKPNDHIWEQDGVKITTDALSSKYLLGTTVDYVSSVTGAGFKFENPNAKSSCGCGTSFTT